MYNHFFSGIGLFASYFIRFKASFKPIKEKVIFWKFYNGFTPQGSRRTKKQVSGKKSFSVISSLEMILSLVFHERKNIIFCGKMSNLWQIILLIMFIVIEFFLTIASY